jgi:hypothetical protein
MTNILSYLITIPKVNTCIEAFEIGFNITKLKHGENKTMHLFSQKSKQKVKIKF